MNAQAGHEHAPVFEPLRYSYDHQSHSFYIPEIEASIPAIDMETGEEMKGREDYVRLFVAAPDLLRMLRKIRDWKRFTLYASDALQQEVQELLDRIEHAPVTAVNVIDDRDMNGWIYAVIDGHMIQAKVEDEPSDAGINGGRVLKLDICNAAQYNPAEPLHLQNCYSHDGELQINEAPSRLLERVLSWCENLDPVYEEGN